MRAMPISSCLPLPFLSDESTRAQWCPHQSGQPLPAGVRWVEVSGDLRMNREGRTERCEGPHSLSSAGRCRLCE